MQAIGHWYRVGGWVMVPLAIVSVLGLAVVLERTIFWIGLSRPAVRRRVGWFARTLRDGNFDAADRKAAESNDPYARLVAALAGQGRRPIGQAEAREAIEAQRQAVERFQGTLSIIITAAPMLGILGTVTGIIDSFAAIGMENGTDPRLVAGGIAQALTTTAFGLAVAVAALFPYAIFKNLADRALTRLELLAACAMEGGTTPTPGAGKRPLAEDPTATGPSVPG